MEPIAKTAVNLKKAYSTPQIHPLGRLEKVQAFVSGRVTESASSGYYDRTLM
jgi:hypothetical protein